MTEKITKKQLQIIQTICSGKFQSREARLEFFSNLLDQDVESSKELNQNEADKIIYYFITGKAPDNTSYALFNKKNAKHLKILSLCKEMHWINEHSGYVDLNRLGTWIRSVRCPVQGKTLKEMDYADLSKIIRALENIVISKYS